jgi:hypothetical protein
MLEGRELESATVAARLKDFHAQPERFGPRYLQGLEPLPDGGIVLRFAQGKFPAAMKLSDAEARELRLAADDFVRRICLWDHGDHYQALCARREAAPESIKENYHLLMGLLHPDRQEGGSDAWPEAFAQRVNLAYGVLGDEESRREYDARLDAAQPRFRTPMPTRDRRGRATEARFAKTLIAVGAVVSALIVVGLMVDDDEWGDRSVLQASLARLRTNPAPGTDRPRYVGSAVAASPRASDAVYDEPEPFALLKPLIRAITGEEPRVFAPAPRLEAPVAAPDAAEAAPVRISQAPAAATPAPQGAPAPALRTTPVLRSPPSAATMPAAAVALAPESSRATTREIEDLVVALVDSYQAGDTERLLGLLEPDAGFWRTVQMRQAYSDFFRATRTRRLRIEKLAWNAQTGSAHARGEATVHAEYFGEAAPVERRVEVELDIVLRDGRARIRRLSLFPDVR